MTLAAPTAAAVTEKLRITLSELLTENWCPTPVRHAGFATLERR